MCTTKVFFVVPENCENNQVILNQMAYLTEEMKNKVEDQTGKIRKSIQSSIHDQTEEIKESLKNIETKTEQMAESLQNLVGLVDTMKKIEEFTSNMTNSLENLVGITTTKTSIETQTKEITESLTSLGRTPQQCCEKDKVTPAMRKMVATLLSKSNPTGKITLISRHLFKRGRISKI